jgi:hypothetical protein
MPYIGTKTLADGEALIPDESVKARQVQSMLLSVSGKPNPDRAKPDGVSAARSARP